MPKLLKTPFAIDAAEGFRTDIQESTGAAPNSATYQVGFPPVTMQSIASNGMPPKGSDLNGVLYDITDNLVFLTQGGGYGFDATYATSIGGYPLNARLRLTNGDIVKSTIDGNTNDPNVDMTGWDNRTFLLNSAVVKTDSLTELKNIKPTIANMRVSIKGYGDGELYWDAASTETANDITVFASNTTSTGRWKWVEFKSVLQGGVIADGTDQTSKITGIISALGALGYRGDLEIPFGVKFNVPTVFGSVPLGMNLKIEDNLNWGQPPNYRNRMYISYGSSAVPDDSVHMIADNHHAAVSLLNTGTAEGSPSANERLASIVHAVGISYAGDPLNAQIMQFRKDVTADKWVTSTRTLISYEIAMKDPSAWVIGKVYAAGDMCLSDGNKVYRTTLGGTAGSTNPTGTGAAINDGGVIWDYYAARRSRDATTFTIDEDGNAANYGNTGDTTSYQVRNSMNRLMLQVDNTTTGTITLRDYSRGAAFLTSSTARGTYLGGVPSLFFGAVLSGATPTVVAAAHRVTNASPTTMTALNLPASQIHGFVLLHFTDANTTLQHGGAFVLKGATNVNPPANGIIQLVRNGVAASSWIEVSRSF